MDSEAAFFPYQYHAAVSDKNRPSHTYQKEHAPRPDSGLPRIPYKLKTDVGKLELVLTVICEVDADPVAHHWVVDRDLPGAITGILVGQSDAGKDLALRPGSKGYRNEGKPGVPYLLISPDLDRGSIRIGPGGQEILSVDIEALKLHTPFDPRHLKGSSLVGNDHFSLFLCCKLQNSQPNTHRVGQQGEVINS